MTGEELYQALGKLTPEQRSKHVLDQYAEHILTEIQMSWYDGDQPGERIGYIQYNTEWWEDVTTEPVQEEGQEELCQHDSQGVQEEPR